LRTSVPREWKSRVKLEQNNFQKNSSADDPPTESILEEDIHNAQKLFDLDSGKFITLSFERIFLPLF